MASINCYIGNYYVINELASGTYGRVYIAQHTFLTRIVAIKLLHSTHLNSQKERDRFLQEARILEKLKQHPHILPIVDVGIYQDSPYLVTEYASNGSLANLVERQAPHPSSIEETL